jgi:hypothetical protein
VRILVTNEPRLIVPAQKDWPTLNTFITQLYGGQIEPYADAQLNVVYGWLKIAYESFRDRRWFPGQALAIAGPVESGKSLFQNLVTEIMGGRAAKAVLFLQGRTDFNGELFGAEHLILEDEAASTLYHDRKALGVNIKNIAANRIHPCHAKHRQIVNLAPWWRLSISLNDRAERLLILPPLDEDIRDKVILLRAMPYPMPMPVETAEQKEQFWNQLMAEVPGFLWFLTQTFHITPEWAARRYGVVSFQHPSLLSLLEELSPSNHLLALIDLAQIWEIQSNIWEGTALELRAILMEHHKTSRDAVRLLSWPNACGQYLNDLCESHPERVKFFRSKDRRWYKIYRKIDI